jgi:hypothetical protein
MNQERLFRIESGLAALVAGLVAVGVPTLLHARDRGINQPGAVGNRPRLPRTADSLLASGIAAVVCAARFVSAQRGLWQSCSRSLS